MDWQHIFWPALVALIWGLKELTVTLRKYYSVRPPPIPPPRSELPTPDYSLPGMIASADGSGRYTAVGYPSYREFETFKKDMLDDITQVRSEMASLRNAIEIANSRMAELSKHLGKLEGLVEARRQEPRR